MIQEGLGLPFEFTRLSGSSHHVLQLENSLENLDDDLERQPHTQGPGRSIITDAMLPRVRIIDRLNVHKNYCRDKKTRKLAFKVALAMLTLNKSPTLSEIEPTVLLALALR